MVVEVTAAAVAAEVVDRHSNASDDDRACEDACVDDGEVVPWQSRRPSWAKSAYAAEGDLEAVDRAMDPYCAF